MMQGMGIWKRIADTRTMNSATTEPGRGPLRVLSSVAPLAGLGLLYPIRLGLMHMVPVLVADAIVGVLMAIGVVSFSWLVFRHIDRQDRQLAQQYAELAARYAAEQHLRARLQTINQAALAIASADTAPAILHRLVDLAREVTGVPYAGLVATGAEGGVDPIFATGIDADLRGRIGRALQEHDVVEAVTHGQQLVRIDDLASTPPIGGRGRPPAAAPRPDVRSPLQWLVAVPIAHADAVAGAFYLVGDADRSPLRAEDEHLLALLANHAGVVIQQARLTEQLRALAVAAERARIRTDLHDGVLQALYAVSLTLDGVDEDLEHSPAAAHAGIATAINGLNRAMERIRGALLNLQEADAAGDARCVAGGSARPHVSRNGFADPRPGQAIDPPSAPKRRAGHRAGHPHPGGARSRRSAYRDHARFRRGEGSPPHPR
jgi:signal transduction histidine kinase